MIHPEDYLNATDICNHCDEMPTIDEITRHYYGGGRWTETKLSCMCRRMATFGNYIIRRETSGHATIEEALEEWRRIN